MSTPPNDGGPAFARFGSSDIQPQSGMSLRDWFAGMALAGMLQYDATGLQVGHVPKRIAADCYAVADAMLLERNKEKA